jgi:PqqD family protein of HPr-rel-A system
LTARCDQACAVLASADPAARLWRLPCRVQLSLRQWDGDFAVFNPLSGHTHILDYIAAALLQALADGPRSEAQLQHSLAVELELSDGSPLQAQLCALLTQLDEQGLIAPASPC